MAGRNAEDEIGIGRKAEPNRTLGGEGNAGKIGGAIKKVENDLKMKMRGPAAIFASVADVSEDFAARDALADFQRSERCGGEMTVESEEVEARRGHMVKDDDGAVIERCSIVGERVDSRAERGGNRSAGFDEEIQAEMNGAALSKWAGCAAEELRGVERARLIVTTDTDGGIRGAQKGL